MRVIGIDPGYDRFGIAIIERIEGKEILVYSTCVVTKRMDSIPDRLHTIGVSLEKSVTEFEPRALAVEQLFFNRNVNTALPVAEARGIALYIAKKNGLLVHEYSPQAVKLAVTGYGKSEKVQVEEMLRRLVRGVPPHALDDEFDAMAVALTCLVSERWNG
jgi:crossover junction endodeoxyribonuclease RuvC